MLTIEDYKNLLSIINQTSFQGQSAEYIVELKNKILKCVDELDKKK